MTPVAWLWRQVARACYVVGFGLQAAGDWCHARYRHQRYGRGVGL